MNIGRAITFPFEDSDWVVKILLGGLITLIPIIGGIIVYGYALEVARRVYLGDPRVLPEWGEDFGGYLVRGLIVAVGVFLLVLPFMLLFGVGVGIGVALARANENLGTVVGFLIGSVVFIGLVAWTVAIVPIASARYAVERRFGAMFELREMFAEAGRAGVSLLWYVVLVVIAAVISNLGIILCFVGVIFTGFYSYLILAHGAGQVYRRARGVVDTEAGRSAF